MPTSPSNMIPHIISCLRALRPESILDIGIGCGKYGLLAREYLQVSDAAAAGERSEPHLRVDGVEAFAQYIGPIQKAVYDQVFVGDVRELVHSLKGYDVALMIDVIEHMTVADGRALLSALLQTACKGIVLTTPVAPKPQGAVLGNEYERHVSQWRPDDFRVEGGVVQWMILERTYLVYVHRSGAPDIAWLHSLRLRRRLSLALRHLANVIVPGCCNCPRI